MRWPKYWSFSLSISPSNEHPGLVSFRMDWLDLFAVQGTLKSLLQHHSSNHTAVKLSLLQSSPCGNIDIHLFWLIKYTYQISCKRSIYRSFTADRSVCRR